MSSSIPQTSGIYKIVCSITNKVYIGSAANLHERWVEHRGKLCRNAHVNQYLQNAWNKHGETAFAFIVLELVLASFLVEREQYWIDKTQCCDRRKGYNLAPTAGSMLGYRHSEETRQKMSQNRKGRVVSEETRRRLKEMHKGRAESPETRRKISDGRRGLKFTEEARLARKEVQKRNWFSPEYRKMMLESRSKEWVVIDPDGNEYIIRGLSEFCRENGLNRQNLHNVAIGKARHYKGWKCRRFDCDG